MTSVRENEKMTSSLGPNGVGWRIAQVRIIIADAHATLWLHYRGRYMRQEDAGIILWRIPMVGSINFGGCRSNSLNN